MRAKPGLEIVVSSRGNRTGPSGAHLLGRFLLSFMRRFSAQVSAALSPQRSGLSPGRRELRGIKQAFHLLVKLISNCIGLQFISSVVFVEDIAGRFRCT